MNHINPSYQKTLVDIIAKRLPSCTIYLYGSRARLQHKEGADVDLALDNKKPIDFSALANIRFDIEESTIPLMVDIVDIHNISQDFLDEIKKDWILWKN